MVFKVDGEKLTGTVTNMYGEEQIAEGSVKGDDVNFVINAGGGQFKILYKGKITGAGHQIPCRHRRIRRRRFAGEALLIAHRNLPAPSPGTDASHMMYLVWFVLLHSPVLHCSSDEAF